MNITPIVRQITEYSLVLNSDDLTRYLNDPAQFVADVSAQLNGGTPVAPAREAARRPAARRASPKARAGRGRKTETQALACPQCDRTFRHAKRLANHLSDVHGQAAAEGEGA